MPLTPLVRVLLSLYAMFSFARLPPPSFPLIHVPEMVEIDAGLVEDNNFTRGNTRTDLARPPVAVLGKEHGSQMAQNAEGASSGIHPSLTDILIQEAARNGVEKLRETDIVRASRFLFHTSAEWSGFILQPTFLILSRHPCGTV